MPDKLRVAIGTGQRRNLVGDIPLRNDLLSRNQQEYITMMVNHVNPYSPYLVFMNLFGSNQDMYGEDREGLFDVQTSTIGSEFIRIQEECEERKPFYVVDNSRVPDKLIAGVPFEVGLDYGTGLDEGEQVKLWDDHSMLSVVSRRNTNNGYVDVTFILNGQQGETASGSLLGIGKPVNWGYGNTMGEGSHTSNRLQLNTTKKNLFTAPTVITRYMWHETGSWMSDEVFRFAMQPAMDGSEPMQFVTSLSVRAFRQALLSLEGMIMDSVSNFDPATLEINSFKGLTPYPDRPLYPGVWQQLDQAHIQYKHPWKLTYLNNFNRIESIMQQIHQVWPDADVLVVAQHGGMKFVRDAIREGGQAKYPVRLTREVGADGKVDVGFGIEKLVTDYGNLFMYDIGKGYRTTGEFKTFTYNGVKGPDRSRDIFFIPIRRGLNGAKKKSFRYFTKSGKNGAHQQVDRGFVFGRVRGFTGEGNGFTGAQLMAMQETAIEDMVTNASRYDVASTVDGNEYHIMFEGVPYIDPTGIIKLRLID
ncbi:hypothetical protein [Dyadobacter sp. BHUBP1]|uniref:hypothetical protein n=1 Tax=Dyadobacter sp. BHUBP1 TaxID=3424178 RepID=UPI003D3395FA